MLLATHKGPPIASLTTWSNPSHFLLFFFSYSSVSDSSPLLCVFPLFSFPLCSGVIFLLHLQWFLCSHSLLTSPLALHRSALIRDDGLQPFLWPSQSRAIQRSSGSFSTHGTQGLDWFSLSCFQGHSCYKIWLIKPWLSNMPSWCIIFYLKQLNVSNYFTVLLLPD